jgi:hypothetical protein
LISKEERWDDFHPEIKSIVETKILDYFQSDEIMDVYYEEDEVI